ncbi:MAG TPA: hypothetical protein VHD39_03395, partial [Acidimicrobiales bacterium]|nr:hypothetical protein [Acidimicrobiales bacterium]
MTAMDEAPWLRPSPGLWRMRRAEVIVLTAVVALLVGIVFLGAGGALPGLISAFVIVAFGGLWALFLRRRFRAWRYQERHEDLLVGR